MIVYSRGDKRLPDRANGGEIGWELSGYFVCEGICFIWEKVRIFSGLNKWAKQEKKLQKMNF